ncbi:MAG: hypothetical protein AAFQ99_11505, partial [Pseudomonadota bacterium]
MTNALPQRRKNLMRRSMIAILACALGQSAGGEVRADEYSVQPLSGALYAKQPFELAFGATLRRLFRDIRGTRCLANADLGRLDLAFIGISPQNVAFHDSLRNRINQRAREVLQNQIVLGARVIDPSTLSTIAQLQGGSALDRTKLAEAIEETTNAPLVLVLDATRPALDVGMLRLEFFARDDTGRPACPKAEIVFVDLKSLSGIPAELLSGKLSGDNYVAYTHAYRYAFRQSEALLTSFDRLAVSVRSK